MPFFGFNSLTGRIAATHQQAAYNPQGIAATVVESAPAEYSSKSVHAVQVEEPVMSAAHGSAAARGMQPAAEGYQKIVALQKAWNVEDGLLVWQKRGMRDKAPMIVTYSIMAVGLAYGFTLLWKMSWPKPVKEDSD